MKRRKKIAVALAGLMALSVLAALYGLTHPPLLPPIASVPFAMDKAGASVRIDFSVTPAQITKRRLMIAMEYPQSEGYTIEDALQQTDFLLHIELFWNNHGQLVPVPIEDDKSILEAGRRRLGMYAGPTLPAPPPQVARLHLYAHDGQTSNVLIVGFSPPGPGDYVATIRTIQDLPMFSGVRTIVKVDDFYNTGK